MSASPVIDPAPPVRGPDIIDHLKSSERLMTARELASILAISPKTIYSYAERNMIPHFKIEASVRFRGRDVAEWLLGAVRCASGGISSLRVSAFDPRSPGCRSRSDAGMASLRRRSRRRDRPRPLRGVRACTGADARIRVHR